MSKKLFIFKLGNIEKGLFPTKESVDKLTKKLKECININDEKGNIALIWGPELEVEEITLNDGDLMVVGNNE